MPLKNAAGYEKSMSSAVAGVCPAAVMSAARSVVVLGLVGCDPTRARGVLLRQDRGASIAWP